MGTPVAVVHLGKDDVCTLRKRRSMACRERTSSGEGREASSFEEKRGGGKAAVSCQERGRQTPGGHLTRAEATSFCQYLRKKDTCRLPAAARAGRGTTCGRRHPLPWLYRVGKERGAQTRAEPDKL